VWVTVRRLRQKLEYDPNDPHHLVTDSTGGYRLSAWELRADMGKHRP
jgi:DNA-binding response OmpR family regulator